MQYKFKGKRKDNGEWVYGSLVSTHPDEAFILLGVTGHIKRDDYECYMVAVKPETVSMHIGEANIWEGSIVECWDNAADEGVGKRHRGKIVYSGAAFVLDVDGVLLPNWLCAENIRVLGNVIDNPELLNPPADSPASNTMYNTDPAAKATEELKEQATELESATQDQAMEVDSEEGSVEG